MKTILQSSAQLTNYEQLCTLIATMIRGMVRELKAWNKEGII
jgi:hypothetical protein